MPSNYQRGLPYMTSGKMDPPVTYRNHLIVFLLSAFWGPPAPPHCGRHIWKPPNVETLDATFPFAGLSPSDTNLTCKSSPPRLWQHIQSLQHKGIYLPCLQPDKHSLRSNVESKWAGRLIHARRKSNWQTCIMCFAERTNQVNNITRDQRKITFSCAFPSS